MWRGTKIHFISESEPGQRSFYEEDDPYTDIVIDRVKERQMTLPLMTHSGPQTWNYKV